MKKAIKITTTQDCKKLTDAELQSRYNKLAEMAKKSPLNAAGAKMLAAYAQELMNRNI